MSKRAIFFTLIIIILSQLTLFSSAQLQTQSSQSRQLTNQGSNFETICQGNECATTIYSYDKYFNRNGAWEEIDESWHTCAEGFCTNPYHFNATVNNEGLVTLNLGNRDFTQRASSFNQINLTMQSPTIEGSILTYQNILPNIDLKYQYLPHKLKEEIIINGPLQNIPQEDFEVTFHTSGNANFNLEYPFICDSNRKCKPINYTLTNNQVTLIIPNRFLINETTVYPVIIDPSFYLGNSSIIWNGRVEETINDEGSALIYPRINNPSSLEIGMVSGGMGTARADIDWNLDRVPNLGQINNATLYLYLETFTGPNFLNITHIEKNSSQWSDNDAGNEQFFYDMRNGSIYYSIYSLVGGGGFPLPMSLNQQGMADINTALATDKRFSIGLDTDNYHNVTISARDYSNSAQRPVLILQHTKEDYNLTYDANGNMISGFGKYMEYDGWNRLSKIRSTNATGSVLAEYFYDHEGKRVLKRAYNVTGNGHNESTYYLNTRPADFIQVINTNGTIINETYIYLQDKLIAKIDTVGQRFFYHPDHLGSTTLVTNESGSVVEDLLYLPYGDILSGDELSRFTYNGQESDRESGFMDYGARQYDARFSRFIEPDPIISDPYNPQDLNRYSYTRNNPYKYVDPTGNIVNVATAIAGAGIGATVSALYSAASQYHSSGSVNFGEVGKNAVVGAIAGGIGGLTFGLGTAAISVGGFAELSAGQAVGLGAISGITSGRSAQLTSNILSGNSLSQNVLDPDAIVRDGIIGGVTGGLVKGLTNSLSKTISLQGNYPSSYKSQIQSANKFFAEQAPEYSFNEHSLNSVLGRIQQGRISSQEAVVDALKNGQKYYDPSYNNYVFIKNNVKVHVDTRTNSVRTVTDGGPKEFYTPVSSGSSSSSGGGS